MTLRCGLIAASMGCLAQAAVADSTALPDFATCMSNEMARFERVLQTEPVEAGDDLITIYGVSGVEFCGTIGIVRCDRSENPLGCQTSLAVTQDIWRARVLDQLPPPDETTTSQPFPKDLYDITYALAHGMSAGQDCAGYQPVLETWCRAREANGRLRAAVLAWQVARHLGHVPAAVDAGWVEAQAPLRPQARPGAQE